MMAAAIDRLDAWEVERQGVPHREPGLDRTAHLSRNALAISRWVDAGLPTDDPAARLWARTAKVAEEAGEVIAAVTDFVGANPRRTGDQDAVIRELCDVAFAALGAIAHLHDNDVDAVAVLADHAARVVARAGIRVSSDQGGPGASGS
jgi:phosphoribosyl-ATP pyrophosphohydrolase